MLSDLSLAVLLAGGVGIESCLGSISNSMLLFSPLLFPSPPKHRYNNQLTVLRSDLRFCKRKSTDQTKQITELQNMLAEQQKQTLEYANRLDENDKKSEEMSRKISTLLQELNKCKIELHYWRAKSPATPICHNCGTTTVQIPPTEDLLAFMNQSISDSSDLSTSLSGNGRCFVCFEFGGRFTGCRDIESTRLACCLPSGFPVESLPLNSTISLL